MPRPDPLKDLIHAISDLVRAAGLAEEWITKARSNLIRHDRDLAATLLPGRSQLATRGDYNIRLLKERSMRVTAALSRLDRANRKKSDGRT